MYKPVAAKIILCDENMLDSINIQSLYTFPGSSLPLRWRPIANFVRIR